MGQTDRVDTLGANGGEGFGSGEVHFQLGVLQPTLGQSPPRLEPDAGLPFLHLKHTCNSFHYNIANSENLPIHFFRDHQVFSWNEIPSQLIVMVWNWSSSGLAVVYVVVVQ